MARKSVTAIKALLAPKQSEKTKDLCLSGTSSGATNQDTGPSTILKQKHSLPEIKSSNKIYPKDTQYNKAAAIQAYLIQSAV